MGTGETAIPSSVPKILRVSGGCPADLDALESTVADLAAVAQHGDAARVVQQLRAILPSFEPVSENPAPIVVEPAAIQTVHPTWPSRDESGHSLTIAITADANA